MLAGTSERNKKEVPYLESTRRRQLCPKLSNLGAFCHGSEIGGMVAKLSVHLSICPRCLLPPHLPQPPPPTPPRPHPPSYTRSPPLCQLSPSENPASPSRAAGPAELLLLRVHAPWRGGEGWGWGPTSRNQVQQQTHRCRCKAPF